MELVLHLQWCFHPELHLHGTNAITAASWADSSCCCPRWWEWALGSPAPPASPRRTQRPAYLLFRNSPALLRIPGEEVAKALSWSEREQSVEKHSTAQLQVCWEQHSMTLGQLLAAHGRTFSWCQHSPDNLVKELRFPVQLRVAMMAFFLLFL